MIAAGAMISTCRAVVCAAAVLGGAVGCSGSGGKDGGLDPGAAPVRPTTATLAPLPQASPTLSFPNGPTVPIELPPGSSARVDPTPSRAPELVVSIPAATLGFEFDRATPADPLRAGGVVTALVDALASSGRVDLSQVEVTGYASAEGDAVHNQRLSDARAAWVCAQLRHRDPALTVRCTGAGASGDADPPGPGPEDRRVELRARIAP